MAGEISLQVSRDNDSCLYLVHRRELVSQIRDTLHKFGLGDRVGIIQSGYPETPWAPLQIASVQSLVNRLARLHWLKPRMLFIDEAHHVRASTWEMVLNHFPDAYRLLLTATPARLDGKGLAPHAGVMLQGPSIAWLSANGYLAEVETYCVKGGLDLAALKATGSDNLKRQDQLNTAPVIAATMKNILKYASDRRSIFYASSIRHSKQVVADCNFQGISAEHVDGDTPIAQREAAMRRYASGVTQLLSNVSLFTEGLDVPETDCIIWGRRTLSAVMYRQGNGRGMRKKIDGRKMRLVDLVDNVVEHGLPDEELEWTLEGGLEKESKRRSKNNVRICSGCRNSYPARHAACPLCGHEHVVRTPTEVEAELELARKAKKDEQRRRGEVARELNRRVVATMGDEDELRRLQIEYGRKPGIIHVWKRVWGETWDRHNNRRAGVS